MANIELLKRLRTRFLRMRHKKHFKMDTVVQKTDCGTAMCIAGHALDLQGYKFRFDSSGNAVTYLSPRGRKVEPLVAAAKEMGLNYEKEAFGLFHDFDIKTPKQAARRMEQLIEKHS